MFLTVPNVLDVDHNSDITQSTMEDFWNRYETTAQGLASGSKGKDPRYCIQ